MSSSLPGTALILVLALPPVRHALERVMVVHMLVQIPLLAVAGALIAVSLPTRLTSIFVSWNARGVTGTLLALIVSSWWMVPRALDLALAEPLMEVTKFVSLPLLVGIPVALSWRSLGGMGQGFVLANVLPMWAAVGWLYVAAPTRLCNFYLVEQQAAAGLGLLWLSIAVALAACARVLVPASGHESVAPGPRTT
ncbi:MAG TPA: hypothetical protein VFT29_01585 [Gemmatimonadaceae bacterium]|nr:hypothetical protein [Gemmatimonadaceae bacterium]